MILPMSCDSINTISRSGFVFRQILKVLSKFIADRQVTIVGLRALALLLTSGTLCLCVGKNSYIHTLYNQNNPLILNY